MRYRHALTTFALAAGLVLTGCANDDDTAGAGSTEPATQAAQATFNDADVEFATNMIPHHRQAIEMAAVAKDRAQNQQVKDLAASIEAAQQPEIDTMSAWLLTWGKPVPDGPAEMAGMGHGGMATDQKPGMMTGEQMDQLHAANGPDFDRMFLTMMITHHEGAIRMAETEQANGSDPDAIALARKIAQDQQAEIRTMQRLVRS